MPKELLFLGGKILTMAEPLYAEAVCVDGETGTVLETGTEELLRASHPGAWIRHLDGAVLMPSFIDSHSHITMYAKALRGVELTGAESFEEIAARLKRRLEELPPGNGEWLTGYGYDNNLLPDHRHPSRELLDRVSAEIPVLISHASGHMGVGNSAALRAFGITADTPDPENGRIGRMSGGREPDGYLEESPFMGNAVKVPQPSMEAQLRLLVEVQEVYLRNGITTIQDGFTKNAELELLKTAASRGLLQADTVCYLDVAECRDLARAHPELAGGYRNRLRIGGYKAFLDGSPQGRTAWMTQPYEGAEDGYRGYPEHTDKEVERYFAAALEDQRQILIHCNGDAAAEQMIRCYRKAREALRNPPEILPVMIHAQLLRRDQLPEMAALRIAASFFVAHTYYWGDVHLRNFGKKRADLISPAKSAMRAGVLTTFHQDTPVLPPDMLDTVCRAVTRATRNGVTLGPEERLTPVEALRAVTRNAAAQYSEQDRKGTIQPGKLADFAVLGRDPLETPPEEIKEIPVLAAIKEGKTVYQKNMDGSF